MVNVSIGTGLTREDVIATLDQTPKQLFDAKNIDYSMGTCHLSGGVLTPEKMNWPLEQFGVAAGDRITLICVVKADSGATLKKLGNSYTLKSEITFDALMDCKKLAPECLQLVDKKDAPIFRVDFASTSSISACGIAFNSVDADGKLYLTHPTMVGEVTATEISKEFARELSGLLEIEAQVTAAKEALDKKVDSISKLVEIID